MRASFNCFLLFVGSIILISVSTQLSDLEEEGSGSDLESDGSGDETLKADSRSYNLTITNNTSVVTDAAVGHRYPSHASYTFDPNISPWGETEPELVMLHRDEEHFFQNKDNIYAVISGALTGTIIAVTITAILIRKWQNEEKEEYEWGDEELQRPRNVTTAL